MGVPCGGVPCGVGLTVGSSSFVLLAYGYSNAPLQGRVSVSYVMPHHSGRICNHHRPIPPAMLHLIITDTSTTNDRYLSTWAAALFNSPEWAHLHPTAISVCRLGCTSPARQSPEGASPNSRGRGGRRTTNLRNTSTQPCVPKRGRISVQ